MSGARSGPRRAPVGERVTKLLPLLVTAGGALAVVALAHRPPTRLDPARAFCAASARHPLGCGEGGVDLLALVGSAVLRGLGLSVAVAVIAALVGVPLGAAAGLGQELGQRRGARVLLRTCDLLQAFPTFLFAMAVLSAVRSPSRVHLFVVFSLTAWAPFARLAEAQARVVGRATFVEAARALGASRGRVLVRHVIPSLLDVAAVQLGATGAAVVVSEAALGFVGFGPGDGVSLGALLDQGVAAMLHAPHVLVVGAVAVFVTSSALLLAGRALGRVAPSGG